MNSNHVVKLTDGQKLNRGGETIYLGHQITQENGSNWTPETVVSGLETMHLNCGGLHKMLGLHAVFVNRTDQIQTNMYL